MREVKIKALIFDVFGTVVDWRKTLTNNLNSYLPKDLSKSDLEEFSLKWRKGYSDYTQEFNQNNNTWIPSEPQNFANNIKYYSEKANDDLEIENE